MALVHCSDYEGHVVLLIIQLWYERFWSVGLICCMVIQLLCTLPVDVSLVCFSSRRPCVQLSRLATFVSLWIYVFVKQKKTEQRHDVRPSKSVTVTQHCAGVPFTWSSTPAVRHSQTCRCCSIVSKSVNFCCHIVLDYAWSCFYVNWYILRHHQPLWVSTQTGIKRRSKILELELLQEQSILTIKQ